LGRPNSSRRALAEAGKKKKAANALTKGQLVTEKMNHSSVENPDEQTLTRKRRRKQVRLSVAMRKIGLDEYMVAENLAGLIESLGKKQGEAKVLLDALKESTRVLEPPPKAYGASESDGPNEVVLRHDIPRPARNASQEQGVREPGAG
jgi:hypothetical protein